MRRRSALRTIVFAGVVACAGFTCRAESGSSAPSPSGWEFQATPYLWALGLDGEIKIGPFPGSGVEASFSDIWSDLHFALMGAFEARHGRWGILVDAFYADLSVGKPTSDPLFGEAQVDLTDQFYTVLGTYRVHDGPVKVDFVFGPRYTRIDADLTLTSGIAAGRTGSTGIHWWDALGGARVGWQSSKGWLVSGYADIGAGGHDDLTWEVIASGGYRFKKLVTLNFGYRYLSVDYDDGTILYDMAMAGPFLGVGFRF